MPGMVSRANPTREECLSPPVRLECNPEIPVSPGEEHWLLDTSLDEVYWSVPTQRLSPGKSERGCGNCAAFHPVDVHLGAFISPTRGTANQPGSTYFVIMGAQSERNEVSGCAARSHRSISSLFCCCPAGDAVHRRLCSPPARGFSGERADM